MRLVVIFGLCLCAFLTCLLVCVKQCGMPIEDFLAHSAIGFTIGLILAIVFMPSRYYRDLVVGVEGKLRSSGTMLWAATIRAGRFIRQTSRSIFRILF
jgi:hypothetical protein